MVFDVYRKNSLKAATRVKRGKGHTRLVAPETKIPGNWNEFFRDDSNKTELFTFLSEHLVIQSYPEGKLLFTTVNNQVLCNKNVCMNECDHEEADTRMLLHLKDCLSSGLKDICIISPDTDVLVILLGIFPKLKAQYDFANIVLQKVLRKNQLTVQIGPLVERLGQQLCQAIPFLHAFSGCDTTSAFKTIGKKKGFQTLKLYRPSFSIFAEFFNTPFQQISEESNVFKVIQRFVILMYARSSDFLDINAARMDMFFKKNQNLENVPPSKNALLQHTKRAIYQTGLWS